MFDGKDNPSEWPFTDISPKKAVQHDEALKNPVPACANKRAILELASSIRNEI